MALGVDEISLNLQQAFNATAAINRMKNLQLGSGAAKPDESNNNAKKV